MQTGDPDSVGTGSLVEWGSTVASVAGFAGSGILGLVGLSSGWVVETIGFQSLYFSVANCFSLCPIYLFSVQPSFLLVVVALANFLDFAWRFLDFAWRFLGFASSSPGSVLSGMSILRHCLPGCSTVGIDVCSH